MLDYSWLWLNEELSDVKIRLVSTQSFALTADLLDLFTRRTEAACKTPQGEPAAATVGKAGGAGPAASKAHGPVGNAEEALHGTGSIGHGTTGSTASAVAGAGTDTDSAQAADSMAAAATGDTAMAAAGACDIPLTAADESSMAAAGACDIPMTAADESSMAAAGACESAPAAADSKDSMMAAAHADDINMMAARALKSEICKEVPAHAAVLATASGYWKARLLRWRSCKVTATPAAPAAPAITAAAAAAAAPTAGAMASSLPENRAAGTDGGEQAQPEGGMESGNDVNKAEVAAADCRSPVRKKHKSEHKEQGKVGPMLSEPAMCSVAVQIMPDFRPGEIMGLGGMGAAQNMLQHAWTEKLVKQVGQGGDVQVHAALEAGDGTAAAVEAATSSAQEDVMTTALVEQLDSGDKLEAAYSVLQHAYTQQFPKDATLERLMQMAVQADRWDMPDSVGACLDEAAKVGLTVMDVITLLSDGWPAAITEHNSFKALVSNCAAALINVFGRAQAVVRQPTLLRAFCFLPLKAVQVWAEQDTLCVDSENTVAVLLTRWFLSNVPTPYQQLQTAAATVLTNSIRAGWLTDTFLLFTLEKLPWFRPEPDAAAILKVMHDAPLCNVTRAVEERLPTEWVKEPRDRDEEQDVVLNWYVTKAQLDQLHKDAGDGETAVVNCPDSLYWCGYMWSLGLSLRDQKSALFVGVRYSSALPDECWQVPAGTPPVLPAKFEIRVHGVTEETLDYMSPAPMHGGHAGTRTLLGVKTSTEPRANSYPPDNFWQDGKLHLQVEMLDIS